MIYVNNLVKTFKKPIREEGVLGMLKTLFSRKGFILSEIGKVYLALGIIIRLSIPLPSRHLL